MVIFDSYVKLPEGKGRFFQNVGVISYMDRNMHLTATVVRVKKPETAIEHVNA